MKNSLKGSVMKKRSDVAIVFDSGILEYNSKNGLNLISVYLTEDTIDFYKVMKVRNGVVEE